MQLTSPRKDTIPSLDGIRGLACLLVLFSHGGALGFYPTPGLSGYGESGIILFFALSGFLMYYHYFQSIQHSWRFSGVFLIRRFFRMYPPYAITLVLSCFFQGKIFISWMENVAFPTLTDYLLLQHVNGHFWTVVAEIKFYLLFPFLCIVLIFLPLEKNLKLLWLIIMWLALCIINFKAHEPEILGTLKFFLVGIIAAYSYMNYPLKEYLPPQIWNFLLYISIFGGAITLRIAYKMHLLNYASAGMEVYVMILAVIVILASIYATERAGYIFTNPFLRFCGTISYSVYLIHVCIFTIIVRNIHSSPVTLTIVSYICLFISGLVFYLCIEKPANDFGHRLSKKIRLFDHK